MKTEFGMEIRKELETFKMALICELDLSIIANREELIERTNKLIKKVEERM